MRTVLLLAVIGQLFVIAASFGVMNRAVMAVILIAAAIAIARAIVRDLARDRQRAWRGLWWLLAFVPLIVLASYPPLAFDETLYHLPFIRSILESGAITLRHDIRFDVFPLLHELLAVPPYAFFGATATHFVAVLEVMLLGALMLAWPRRREAGWLAAAITLGNPPLLLVGSITYVDAALALFVAAGFFCLDRGRVYQEPNDSQRPLLHDPMLWAGFLLGTSSAVKYLGYFFVAAGVLYAGRRWWRYAIGAMAGVAPMMLRIFVLTGAPLHPYFSASDWAGLGARDDGMLWRAVHFVRALYDITFARQYVNFQPPYTPLFAVAFIVAIFFARRWGLGLLCGVYLLAFVTAMSADSRYLLPLVPLVAVPAATYASERLSRRAMRALAIVAALPLLLYPAWSIARLGPLPVTSDSRHAFQLDRIPGLRLLEQKEEGSVYVCGAEELKFFGGDTLTGDYRGRYAYRDVFAGRLATLDAQWFLVNKKKCRPHWRAQVVAISDLAAEDADAELWRRRRN